MEGKERQRILKEDMYWNLRGMMERGEIELLDDLDLRISLASIQMSHSDSDTKSKNKIFGRPSDLVEGLIRAAWLYRMEKSLNLYAY
jgi:hypothetical protein